MKPGQLEKESICYFLRCLNVAIDYAKLDIFLNYIFSSIYNSKAGFSFGMLYTEMAINRWGGNGIKHLFFDYPFNRKLKLIVFIKMNSATKQKCI